MLFRSSTDHEHLRSINSPMLLLVDADGDDREMSARLRRVLELPGNPVLTRRSDPLARAAQLRRMHDAPPPEPRYPFAGFEAERIDELLGRGVILECNEGIKLISARQNTRTVYVVLEGELEGWRGSHEFRIGPGEIVGELAFLTGSKRSADVYVRSPKARVLCLDEKTMRALTDEGSALAPRFLRNMSAILATRLAA